MEDNKKINIVGTNNRYMIKKVLHEPFVKRVKKWDLPDDLHQLDLINDTQNPNVQVVIREINKKI